MKDSCNTGYFIDVKHNGVCHKAHGAQGAVKKQSTWSEHSFHLNEFNEVTDDAFHSCAVVENIYKWIEKASRVKLNLKQNVVFQYSYNIK